MNFEELGLALRGERERQGLSIEVVMEATKISRTNIVAMEAGDRATLPHPVYTRGFVKSYARYLGLDADELVMIVDHEYRDEANGPEEHIYEVSPAAEKAFQNTEPMEGKKRSILPLLLVIVLLVGMGILLFINLTGKGDVDDTAQPPAVSESTEESAIEPAPAVEEADSATQEAAEEQAIATQEAAEEEAAVPVPDAVDEEQAAPEAASEVTVAPVQDEPLTEVDENAEVADRSDSEGSQAEKQKYEHMLVIRAITNKGCWVGVWRGNETKMARDFVLQKGEPLRLMFNSPRRIRIGNVAGVTVTYNGKPYPLDNAKGNIQTLRFEMD